MFFGVVGFVRDGRKLKEIDSIKKDMARIEKKIDQLLQKEVEKEGK